MVYVCIGCDLVRGQGSGPVSHGLCDRCEPLPWDALPRGWKRPQEPAEARARMRTAPPRPTPQGRQ